MAEPSSPKVGDSTPRNGADWKIKMAAAISASQQLNTSQGELQTTLKASQENLVKFLSRLQSLEEKIKDWKVEDIPPLELPAARARAVPQPTAVVVAHSVPLPSTAVLAPQFAQITKSEPKVVDADLVAENNELKESLKEYQITIDFLTTKYQQLLTKVSQANVDRQKLLETSLATERAVNEKLRAQNVTLKEHTTALLNELRNSANEEITERDAELAITELIQENDFLRKVLDTTTKPTPAENK